MDKSPMIIDLAKALAEEYHGRPVDREYITEPATGGEVFIRLAERAFCELARNVQPTWQASELANTPLYGLAAISSGLAGKLF